MVQQTAELSPTSKEEAESTGNLSAMELVIGAAAGPLVDTGAAAEPLVDSLSGGATAEPLVDEDETAEK